MNWVLNIKQMLKGRMKLLLSLGFVLLLCACGGDDPESCGTLQDAKNFCPLCSVFKVILTASGNLAESAWTRLAKELSNVVIVVAAIYIAIYVLKLMGSFGKQTAADFLTGDKNGVMIFTFKAVLIYALLRDDSFFLTTVIFPLLASSLEIGIDLSAAMGSPASLSISGEVKTWGQLFDMLYSAVETINDQVYYVVTVGQSMICHAVIGSPPIVKWDNPQLLYGCIVFMFGWVLLLGVSFYMLDVIIRLSFAAVLLPVGIACAISSRLSMGYAKNIWNLFLNVFFSFIMLGIIMALVIQVVTFCLNGDSMSHASTTATATVKTASAIASRAAFGAAVVGLAVPGAAVPIQAIIDANDVALLTRVMLDFGHLILTIICFAVMIQLVEQMGKLAGEISDTAGFAEIAPASTQAAKVAKPIAENAQKLAVQGTKKMVQYPAHVASRITRMDKLYQWTGRKMTDAKGFLFGSGPSGYKAWWRRRR